MENLFAPWRIEWVERDDGESVDGCPFCVLPERGDDRAHRIVARSKHSFVLQNNYPYNPGHVMVIPRRHTGAWDDLSDEELLDHARLKSRTLEALADATGADGFNAGENIGGSAAGGSIADHLHTHVVPRWTGDTNFMPVVADTKVIVEGMADTYEKLRVAFAAMEGATIDGDDDAVRF